MKNKILGYSLVLSTVLSISIQPIYAQYAPQAPLDGHEGIHRTDARIIGWADSVSITRGYIDIMSPELGYASSGVDTHALGVANGSIVSLGDKGSALIVLSTPIYDRDGPDFCIFENGFKNPVDEQEAYLELAFVEVSSDGSHFVRFPSASLTDTSEQVSNFSYLDARRIHHLAGKYIGDYATPFDLSVLRDSAGLDILNVTHIRIVDVIGSIDTSIASRDDAGRIINDPYPSHFTSSGFDLDAVGLISVHHPNGIHTHIGDNGIKIFPSPARDYIHLQMEHPQPIMIYDILGRIHFQSMITPLYKIDISAWASGIYLLHSGSSSVQFRKL